jgi:hypothetical protein
MVTVQRATVLPSTDQRHVIHGATVAPPGRDQSLSVLPTIRLLSNVKGMRAGVGHAAGDGSGA